MALSFAPTYSMYPEYARDTVTEWVVGHREQDFTLDLDHARALVEEHRPAVVLLPSPNNPTGTALPPEAVTTLCEAVGDGGIVVVDEAYGEFRRAGTPSALELLPRHRNLVVTRTMSKAFALAGAPARLPRRRPGDLRRDPRRAAALPPLRGDPGDRAGGAAARARAARHGSTSCGPSATRPSAGCASRGSRSPSRDANFVLFGVFDDRHAVWQGLLDRGVLIRETGPGRLAAGVDRHAGRDGRVQGRTDRGDGGRDDEPHRPHRAADQRVQGRSSRSTSTAPGATTSRPASASTTTCSPRSPGTRWST